MLCVLARNAKYGDRDAALKMIQQFQPLLQKYSRKLGYVDAYNDLILFFIELISKIPEHLIIESKEGKLVKYITISLKNQYCYLLKQKIFLSCEINLSQLSDEQRHCLESSLSTVDQIDNESILHTFKNLLSPNELRIIILIYYWGFSSAEIARHDKITRQAVNQLKHRALAKIKKAFLNE